MNEFTAVYFNESGGVYYLSALLLQQSPTLPTHHLKTILSCFRHAIKHFPVYQMIISTSEMSETMNEDTTEVTSAHIQEKTSIYQQLLLFIGNLTSDSVLIPLGKSVLNWAAFII
jgi:hypothetical protein